MRAMKTTMGIATVAIALVAALGAPALAVAAPAHSRSVATTPTPRKRVVQQYKAQSRARLNKFRNNARVITRKLNRYSAMASRVESAGADVTAVRGHISDARTRRVGNDPRQRGGRYAQSRPVCDQSQGRVLRS